MTKNLATLKQSFKCERNYLAMRNHGDGLRLGSRPVSQPFALVW
jgi:hypothetical protein